MLTSRQFRSPSSPVVRNIPAAPPPITSALPTHTRLGERLRVGNLGRDTNRQRLAASHGIRSGHIEGELGSSSGYTRNFCLHCCQLRNQYRFIVAPLWVGVNRLLRLYARQFPLIRPLQSWKLACNAEWTLFQPLKRILKAPKLPPGMHANFPPDFRSALRQTNGRAAPVPA